MELDPRPQPRHHRIFEARRIGEALARAYDGELDYHYDEDSALIRVQWRREG